MKSICLFFQVHQPYRLRRFRFFDIGKEPEYFDDFQNNYILKRVAEKCYLPMNKLLLDLIKEFGSQFRVSFSISGTAIDQFEEYYPEVLDSFKKLAKTGSVEFLAETNSHSLASLKNKEEFFAQVSAHKDKITKLFGKAPKVFRNTEMIYSDEIGANGSRNGFQRDADRRSKTCTGLEISQFPVYQCYQSQTENNAEEFQTQ